MLRRETNDLLLSCAERVPFDEEDFLANVSGILFISKNAKSQLTNESKLVTFLLMSRYPEFAEFGIVSEKVDFDLVRTTARRYPNVTGFLAWGLAAYVLKLKKDLSQEDHLLQELRWLHQYQPNARIVCQHLAKGLSVALLNNATNWPRSDALMAELSALADQFSADAIVAEWQAMGAYSILIWDADGEDKRRMKPSLALLIHLNAKHQSPEIRGYLTGGYERTLCARNIDLEGKLTLVEELLAMDELARPNSLSRIEISGILKAAFDASLRAENFTFASVLLKRLRAHSQRFPDHSEAREGLAKMLCGSLLYFPQLGLDMNDIIQDLSSLAEDNPTDVPARHWYARALGGIHFMALNAKSLAMAANVEGEFLRLLEMNPDDTELLKIGNEVISRPGSSSP